MEMFRVLPPLLVVLTAVSSSLPCYSQGFAPGTKFSDLALLPGGTYVAVSPATVYLSTDPNLETWTAAGPLTASPGATIRGGDPNRVYLTIPKFDPDSKSSAELVAWAADGQSAPLAKLTEELCTFSDAKVGAYADQNGAWITTDAGKSWTPRQEVFGAKDPIIWLEWASNDSLLVGTHGGRVGMFRVTNDGKLSVAWELKFPDKLKLCAIAPTKTIWLLRESGKLHAVDPKSGDITASSDLPPNAERILATKNHLFAQYEHFVGIYETSPKMIAHQRNVPAELVIASVTSGESLTVIASDPPALFRITDAQEKPQPIATRINEIANKNNVATRLDLATDAELKAFGILARQLTPAEQRRVMEPLMARRDLTPRQKLQWGIVGFQTAIATKRALQP